MGEIVASRFFPSDWNSKAISYACILVSDTGCGMDAATQERVFEPFFTTKFTGRGLGMSEALGLVRSYGGAIAVESQLGRGTTFRLIFPTSEPETPASYPAASPVPLGRHGAGLVLMVDDDPMIRILFPGPAGEIGLRGDCGQ